MAMRGGLAALALGSVLLAGGCIPEDIGGAFVVVNESDRPIYLSTHEIPPDGGRYVIGGSGCSDPGFRLYDSRGEVVVELAEEWCSGQVLTVHGPDDYDLEDADK